MVKNNNFTVSNAAKIGTLVVSIITYTSFVVSYLFRMEAEISLISQKQEIVATEFSQKMEILERRTKSSEDAIYKLNISLERTNTILERIDQILSSYVKKP